MAGPSIGTWVKVRNKSGRTTARVIAKKFGGGSYSQGEVITQSEYNSYKDKRAEGMKAEASGGGGGQAKARLPKAALSKREKTSILLKNKKRIKAEASKNLADNSGQINRMNRLEKADRARRKAENPNSPAFQRARKAADTKRKNASGGGQQKPAGRRLQKAALSKQQKADILERNSDRMLQREINTQNESRIKADRLNKKKREVRRKNNPNSPAFKRGRTAAETRRANARRKEEARR